MERVYRFGERLQKNQRVSFFSFRKQEGVREGSLPERRIQSHGVEIRKVLYE
jgi:hypothetical protein